jgi:hypothetical protein
MNELTLEAFLSQGKSDFVKENANFLIVELQVGDSSPELIINPKENFGAKMAYYEGAYRNDLKLKSNPEIKIVHYEFVENLKEYMDNYEG